MILFDLSCTDWKLFSRIYQETSSPSSRTSKESKRDSNSSRQKILSSLLCHLVELKNHYSTSKNINAIEIKFSLYKWELLIDCDTSISYLWNRPVWASKWKAEIFTKQFIPKSNLNGTIDYHESAPVVVHFQQGYLWIPRPCLRSTEEYPYLILDSL